MVALLQGHLFTKLFVNYVPMSYTSKEVDRRDLTNKRVGAVVKLCMKKQQPTI